MHQRVYLLHATLGTVIVEVCPRHTTRRAAAGNGCTQFGTDDRRADYGTEMFVVGHPFRLHVLYPVAVAQHHAVKLSRVQDGEVQVYGFLRNIGYQVHTCLELVADGRNHHRADDLSRTVHENRADKVRAGNAWEAYPFEALNTYLTHAVGRIVRIGVLKRLLAAHDFLARQYATLRPPDVLQRHHGCLGTVRLVCGIVTAVAAVVLSLQVVIDTLAPEKRLVHHPVAFRAVQLRLRAVCVLVAVGIVKGVVGHLAVEIVHRRILPGHVHVARGGFLGDLCQYPVPLFQNGRNMAAGYVGRSVSVARSVVKVRHVGVVGHCVVELYHRVVRLPDVQFRKLLLHRRILAVLHVSGEPHGTYQPTVVHRIAFCVHALQCLEPAEQRTVVLHVNAFDADPFHAHAPAEDSLPVKVRTAGKAQRFHRAPVLQCQSAVLQFRQILQPERLYIATQLECLCRCARCNQHGLYVHAPCVQRLQSCLRREVQFLA